MWLWMVGCMDYGAIPMAPLGDIALTAGDFDDVREPFNRNDVDTERFEGLISTATWDDRYRGDEDIDVEELLPSMDDLTKYNTLILASGTRGFGATVYNGVAPDDAFVSDPDVVDHMRAFVAQGRTLVVTDWAYDLVEVAWPDQIEFLGDDATLDAAQKGEIGTVTAAVADPRLERALGMDEMAVRFDYSTRAVIDEVEGDDARVWLTADTTWRASVDDGLVDHPDTPLLVTLQPEGTDAGRLIVCSFHLDAQTDAVVDSLIDAVVGDLSD
jgi:hypothetical protein